MPYTTNTYRISRRMGRTWRRVNSQPHKHCPRYTYYSRFVSYFVFACLHYSGSDLVAIIYKAFIHEPRDAPQYSKSKKQSTKQRPIFTDAPLSLFKSILIDCTCLICWFGLNACQQHHGTRNRDAFCYVRAHNRVTCSFATIGNLPLIWRLYGPIICFSYTAVVGNM